MRSTLIRGTLLVALALTAGAKAEDLSSANSMLPGCKVFLADTPGITLPKPPLSAYEAGFCEGTVNGIAFLAKNADLSPLAFSGAGQRRAVAANWRCANIPDGVTLGQIVRVVVRYIELRPNRMHESFKSLALEAILDAWPCRD